MTATYHRAGIQFEYPENWTITDDQFSDEVRLVSIESPGGGYWTLQIFPTWVSPWKATEEVVNTLKSDYDSLESEQVTESLCDFEIVGYDMNFYCLDFVVAAKTRAIYSNGRTCVFVYQAEDREFQQIEPVFLAMMVSVLRHSAAFHEHTDGCGCDHDHDQVDSVAEAVADRDDEL